MDGWDEHYTNTCSPSMEDMVESHNDYDISSMEANIHKPSYNKKCDLSSMESDQDYTFIIPSKRDIDKLAKSRDATSSSRRRHKDKSSNFPSSSRRRHNMSANMQEPHHVDHHMDRHACPQRELYHRHHHVDPHEHMSTRRNHMEHGVDHQGHRRHEDPPRRNHDLHRHSSSSSRRRPERSASAHDQASRLATDLHRRIEHLDDEARGWSLRHLRLELFLQDKEEILLPRHHATTPTPQVRDEARKSKNSNNKVCGATSRTTMATSAHEAILHPRHHATTPTLQVHHEERKSKNSNNKDCGATSKTKTASSAPKLKSKHMEPSTSRATTKMAPTRRSSTRRPLKLGAQERAILLEMKSTLDKHFEESVAKSSSTRTDSPPYHMVSSPSATTTMAPKVQHEDLLCYKCHDRGHHPLACPNNICGKCQIQGHTFWECPNTRVMVATGDKEQEPQEASTLQDGGQQGQAYDEVDSSHALDNTTSLPQLL